MLNPQFVKYVSQELIKTGGHLFNMGQVHAAMGAADRALEESLAAAALPPEPSVQPTPITTALDEVSEPVSGETMEESQQQAEPTPEPQPSAPTKNPGRFGRGRR